MAIAFVFPGQGSQSPGMLDGFVERFDAARACLQEANDALGLDLAKLIAEGPASELGRTEITQPAMLAAGVAVYRVWLAAGGRRPDLVAGHSLGEYTALVCAGVLEFADALRLVQRRGQLMQQAVPGDEGAMAALLGLDDEAVHDACTAAAEGEVVSAVNFNAPGQVVIAGHRAAVERAISVAQEAGARRAVLLPISAPCHSTLMRPAAEGLAPDLEAVSFERPQMPVVNNVDVAVEQAPERIRDALLRQLYSPVRWVETVTELRRRGATQVVECGPGKVLTGLVRRIDRALTTHALTDPEALAEVIARTAEDTANDTGAEQ